MESIDFIPNVSRKPFCSCFPKFYYSSTETPDTVRKKMVNWIKEHGDKISITDIEIFDYESLDWIIQKSHFRVWYTKNN